MPFRLLVLVEMLKFIICKPAVRCIAAFSLVEVTLALGIAAICLVALFGLMPVGVQTNRSATSQTAATAASANGSTEMFAALDRK